MCQISHNSIVARSNSYGEETELETGYKGILDYIRTLVKRLRPAYASAEHLQAIYAAHADDFASLEAVLPLPESD